jgi:hypothetical protein
MSETSKSQKDLFKQYLASRTKLDEKVPEKVIQKYELIQKYDIKKKKHDEYSDKLKNKFINELDTKKKRSIKKEKQQSQPSSPIPPSQPESDYEEEQPQPNPQSRGLFNRPMFV